MRIVAKVLLILVLLIVGGFLVLLGVGVMFARKPVTWGVNFSQMQTQALGLDWKDVYTAYLEDLGAKNIKLVVNWDFVEGQKEQFYFNDLDWQVSQAEQ